MKSDTDQLYSLIKCVPVFSISEICSGVKSKHDIDGGVSFLNEIARVKLQLPTGTVFRVAELDNVLNKVHILIIAGVDVSGNIIVTIDKAALDLERVLFDRMPDMVGVVKSISFPNINKPRTIIAIGEIVSSYQDMVMKTRLGLNDRGNLTNTLLNSIFEFAVTGNVLSVTDREAFD